LERRTRISQNFPVFVQLSQTFRPFFPNVITTCVVSLSAPAFGLAPLIAASFSNKNISDTEMKLQSEINPDCKMVELQLEL
jgi:hypothetical protein